MSLFFNFNFLDPTQTNPDDRTVNADLKKEEATLDDLGEELKPSPTRSDATKAAVDRLFS